MWRDRKSATSFQKSKEDAVSLCRSCQRDLLWLGARCFQKPITQDATHTVCRGYLLLLFRTTYQHFEMASGTDNASPTPGFGLSCYANAMGCGKLYSSIGSGTSEYSSCQYPVPETWYAPDTADAADAADHAKPPTSATDADPTLLEEHTEPNLQIACSTDNEELDCGNTRVVDGAAPVVGTPQVTLVNQQDFLPVMMLPVSPQGRLIQPVPSVRFVNLIEDMQYVVWISFVHECGHVGGDYMHPDSPLPGYYWNDRLVSFSHLKLYAANGLEKKPISLMCTTNYFLRINYGIVNDAGHILANTVIRKYLVNTCFMPFNCSTFSSPEKKPRTGSGRNYKGAKH